MLTHTFLHGQDVDKTRRQEKSETAETAAEGGDLLFRRTFAPVCRCRRNFKYAGAYTAKFRFLQQEAYDDVRTHGIRRRTGSAANP